MSSAHAVPFYCPYCGDEDIEPDDEPGSYRCSACARVFALRFIGLARLVAPRPTY
jgi:predicted RNA-binding Zn-ribbon protein involved in translation (DUF1610 family)